MADMIRYFITKKCQKCKQCMEACPEGAIYEADDKCGIDDELCKGCGFCTDVCPVDAIVHESDPYRGINREADSFFGGGAYPILRDKIR